MSASGGLDGKTRQKQAANQKCQNFWTSPLTEAAPSVACTNRLARFSPARPTTARLVGREVGGRFPRPLALSLSGFVSSSMQPDSGELTLNWWVRALGPAKGSARRPDA